MRKVARNCKAIFGINPNIYAISMAGKVFALQRKSHTIVVSHVEAPIHPYDKWFTSIGSEFCRTDWDDFLIVKYRWYDRSEIPVSLSTDRQRFERESTRNREIAEENADRIEIFYRDLPTKWNIDNWHIPLSKDSPKSNFPYSFITSVADTYDGCTILACDILGDVWELDKE